MPSRKRKLNNSGILSNSYIPPLRAHQIEKELVKLSPDSLYSLTYLWFTLSATQPTPNHDQIQQGYTKESLAKIFIKRLDNIKKIKAKSQMKRKLMNLILVEFYPQGLNTLQLAQIDVQLLVDKPNSNLWTSSTAKIVNSVSESPAEGDELQKLRNYIFSLDSQLFLDNFILNLSNLYLSHVYISRHPYYPLILIRIQMYDHSYRHPIDTTSSRLISDLTNASLEKTAKIQFEKDFKNIVNNKSETKADKFKRNGLQRQIKIQHQPQIIPHKPFYILLPISSPHIIHTPSTNDDVSTKLIIQTLESTLSYSHLNKDLKDNGLEKNRPKSKQISSIVSQDRVKIFKDADVSTPIRNLNSIFILKGISRFGSSIGPWAPYADGIVDMGIFENELKHIAIQPEKFIDLTDDIGTDNNSALKERKIVAALKFKGSVSKVKSKKLFETGELDLDSSEVFNNVDQNNIETILIDDDENDAIVKDDVGKTIDAYASLVPIHESRFQIEDDIVINLVNKEKDSKKQKPIAKSERCKFNFQMDLLGSDIFGGLHELAVRDIIDPYKVPDWLTGETGSSGGIVKKGKFKKAF